MPLFRDASYFGHVAKLWLAMVIGCSFSSAQSRDGRLPSPAVSARAEGSRLPSRTNEFGLWAGYSPFSFVLKGTSKDRELLLLNLQYARTLVASRWVTLKYTADAVPLVLEFQPTQRYRVDGRELVNPASTIYGAGANPVGVQANFGSKRIQPCVNGSLGFVYFHRPVPILESSQFNYTITIGFGAQFFLRPGRTMTVGWKYHHLSNDNQGHLNPGLDSGVFYVGFSVFSRHHD